MWSYKIDLSESESLEEDIEEEPQQQKMQHTKKQDIEPPRWRAQQVNMRHIKKQDSSPLTRAAFLKRGSTFLEGKFEPVKKRGREETPSSSSSAGKGIEIKLNWYIMTPAQRKFFSKLNRESQWV